MSFATAISKPGFAAVCVLANTLAAKMTMTLSYRLYMLLGPFLPQVCLCVRACVRGGPLTPAARCERLWVVGWLTHIHLRGQVFGKVDKEAIKRCKDSPRYKNMSSAQLNEAEYAPGRCAGRCAGRCKTDVKDVEADVCHLMTLLTSSPTPFLSTPSAALAAMLLYLQVKGAEAPVGCTLAAISGPIYFWGRTLSGMALPFTPMGAGPRYIAFGLLIAAIYGTL